MRPIARLVLHLALSLLPVAAASGQHCGGPCEVARPWAAPIAPNARFALVPGPEKANWRYLSNFHWAEDGEPKHHVEDVLASPDLRFGLRQIFVSPAGNGFLVAGRPYAEKWSGIENPSLLVFCSPDGTIAYCGRVDDVLMEEERVLGPCPSCDCCKDVLYSFEKFPELSANAAFVELVAAGTSRSLAFFLPLGVPVADRAAFEARLEALDWERLPTSERATRRGMIAEWVVALSDERPEERARAEKALLAEGLRSRFALRLQMSNDSGRTLDFLRSIDERLRPWSDVGYERMSTDLSLLAAWTTEPEEPIAAAAHARLEALVPHERPDEWPRWVAAHRDRVRWDETRRVYVPADR